MTTTYHNPLYPSNEEVDDLEAAAREAEFIDDTEKMLKKHKSKRKGFDTDDFDDDDFADNEDF